MIIQREFSTSLNIDQRSTPTMKTTLLYQKFLSIIQSEGTELNGKDIPGVHGNEPRICRPPSGKE